MVTKQPLRRVPRQLPLHRGAERCSSRAVLTFTSLGEGGGPRQRWKELYTMQKLPQSPIGDSPLTEGAENDSKNRVYA